MSRDSVRAAFLRIDAIEDDELRAGVVDAWTTALAETDDDLADIPWLPPEQERLGLPDETLVDHVNDVVELALGAAETLRSRREVDLSLDVLLAGALVHDVSKLYEFDDDGTTEIGDLLGHPHFGVHPVAAAGLPPAVQHVVLAHTPRTSVEPATLEAELVRLADEMAAAAIRLRALDDLREA